LIWIEPSTIDVRSPRSAASYWWRLRRHSAACARVPFPIHRHAVVVAPEV